MKRIIAFYDFTIYRLAFHSLRRMCKRNLGTPVLLKLWLDDYLAAHPVQGEQAELAHIYYEQHMKRRKP